jgi:ABC-type multidrug transport system ATPase subunit
VSGRNRYRRLESVSAAYGAGVRDGAVRLDGVGHSYGSAAPVLIDVGVAVEPGAVLVVRGRNGAGKTTLLRVAAGVLRPRAGRVRRIGRTGYLPQRSDDPPPRLSPLSWLVAVARMGGAAGCGDRLDILRALGVESATAALDTLSVGTLAKVTLAGALGGSPDVLVLDEPFASLDSAARDVALGLIASAARDGAAVLVSDHDGVAVGVGTHVAAVEGGRLVVEAVAAAARRVRIVGADGRGVRVDVVISVDERDPMLLRLLRGGGSIERVEEMP